MSGPATRRPGAPVLTVDDVSHSYPDGPTRLTALDQVSMTVTPGELVCLAGPSGSGKSSLCHLAAGLEQPDTGTVQIDGTPPARLDWSVVSVLPQQHGLVTGLTTLQNIRLPGQRLRRSEPATDEDGLEGLLLALDVLHLADRAVTDTSIGEQQRIALARALSLTPRLSVLDEPTGHQDDDHVEQVLAALRGATRRGTAILVASHDSRVVEAADRVVRLDGGRLA
jgi:ABC-type lipoprotein export system ATPase subunit